MTQPWFRPPLLLLLPLLRLLRLAVVFL